MPGRDGQASLVRPKPVSIDHHRSDPLVAAVSVLLFLFTLIVVFVVERAIGLRRAFVA